MKNSAKPDRHAFTLIELMISIALVLVILVGVNKVFTATSDTAGTGQALSAAIRDSRAAQTVFYNDARAAVGTDDSPFFLIKSKSVAAFRDQKDQLGAINATNPASDLDPANPNPSSPITYSPVLTNNRMHRTDLLRFFARDFFKRQTGSNGTFVGSDTSNEAYISYGHLAIRDNNLPASATFTPPVLNSTNPNNTFATQWTLGRNVILLSPSSATAPKIDTGGGVASLLFDYAAKANTESVISLKPVYSSRYDLAATSITATVSALSAYIQANPAGDWWSGLTYNFQADPFLLDPTTGSKALNSATMAQASPIFLNGCTQFIVEYAGDFLTQEVPGGTDLDGDGSVTPGKVVSASTDGQIDFVMVNGVKQIRWYGLPRNVDTSDDTGSTPLVRGQKLTNANDLIDVVPLRDVLNTAGLPAASFERTFPTATPSADYGSAMTAGSTYLCAWGPGDPLPKMLRITIVLEDANGRLADGQTYQYVVTLPN